MKIDMERTDSSKPKQIRLRLKDTQKQCDITLCPGCRVSTVSLHCITNLTFRKQLSSFYEGLIA